MKPEEIFGKDYSSFGEKDPFNKNNTVEGYVSKKANEYYGAVLITKVNNKPAPQLIMGTPKIRYPFITLADGTRRYQFPSAKYIEAYFKMDGTNVLAYSYIDNIGNKFYSYKTRLRPFLSTSRFGNFLELWKEVASPYFKEIEKLMTLKGCNLSFEMYGKRNPHLIAYDIDLDIRLLFGVTNTGKILSLSSMLDYEVSEKTISIYSDDTTIPVAGLIKYIDKDYVYNYEELQRVFQSKLVRVDDNMFEGLGEGTVWYLHTHDGQCILFKNKPESIEAIHFSAGAGGLCKNVILATCWNAFEDTDIVTTGFVSRLLLEEFAPSIIDSHQELIGRCVTFVNEEMSFREVVLGKYKSTERNILIEKAEVMRALSQDFPKSKMKKIYNIIKVFG